MTREEAIDYNKNLRMYMKLSDKNQPCKFLEENYIALDMAIKALEQEPCEDWYDIPSDEMTLGQARQAVKDLRKMWAEHLPSVSTRKAGWIPVSERLPEDFGLYLITLENGDVCQCEFNPDFIDEEHENGVFTYYHQYFDGATLGMIDEEEEAVDAIAWMPFEPYEPQENEK